MKLTYDIRSGDGKVRIGCTDNPHVGMWHPYAAPVVQDTDIGLKTIAFSTYWDGLGINTEQVYLLVPVETVKRKVINKAVPKKLVTKAAVSAFLDRNVVEVREVRRGNRSKTKTD